MKESQLTKDLVLTIIQIIFCNLITGIISLVFLISANEEFKVGNINLYAIKVKNAKIARIVGWVMSIFMYILVIILYALGLVTAASYIK